MSADKTYTLSYLDRVQGHDRNGHSNPAKDRTVVRTERVITDPEDMERMIHALWVAGYTGISAEEVL